MKNYLIIPKEEILNREWSFNYTMRRMLSKYGWHYDSLDNLQIIEFKKTYHVKEG